MNDNQNPPSLGMTFQRAPFDKLRRLREDIANGESNAIGNVTLALNLATTVVDMNVAPAATLCSPDAFIDLMPTNAAMATEWNTTRPWVSTFGKGQFTITHANNGTTRTLRFAILVPSRR